MTIQAIPLTTEAFSPFGTVIPLPLPDSVNAIPDTPPPNAVLANQKTALKYPDLSPFKSTYRLSPSGIPARPTTSLFSCFPRKFRNSGNQSLFDVRILERHPFTTQSFIPVSAPSSANTKLLIVVAPTLSSPEPSSALTPYFPQYNWKQGGPPDLKNLRAFLAEPGMGISYEVGTWHAPMIVVGEERVDFVVNQWMSGRQDEDCQEVEIWEACEIVLDEHIGTIKLKPKL